MYVDPLFPDPTTPIPGMFEQHRVGANTAFSASAIAGPLTFTQWGSITPAGGEGVLQLDAYAEITYEGFVFASFESVGFENANCFTDVFGTE